MTTRKPAGSILVALATILTMSFLLPVDTENATEYRDASSSFSVVEPALRKVIADTETNREEVPTELALPSTTPQVANTARGETIPEVKVPVGESNPGQLEIQKEIDILVQFYAAKYGVDPSILRDVARCESRDNPEATGKEGERGVAQFMKSTWEGTPMGRFGWNAAYHPAINIEAAAWMLSEGRVSEFHAIPCPR
ncbi:MAG: hypothetical protein A2Z78_00530 [Candidatus Nealsonbacteria bacterium RBG_13_36_15]|uniref:Transglycosylase SLT domain-containing protein n=1 Tax=Candidatus Nealsonbacteria bacterium RBG_13_36_15 TaxID=1801660 RepID=A0A1G2DVC1_9BACT|nr:MAG: hypothetical protein A2Z78_00530 [Candidatus Nealsonbacteria bacterium RBG_13_36_15]